MNHVARQAWRVAIGLVLGLAFAPRLAHAQESFFSLNFLGISEETGDVRARGFGVLGIALPEDKTAIALNPASMAQLSRMTLSVMGLAGSRTSRDALGEAQQGVARFPHQRFALPIPGNFVISAGFVGLRNTRSNFRLPVHVLDGFTYLERFERDGTLYTIPIGLARNLGPHVHLGLTLDFLLGTIDESWTVRGDSLIALRTRRRDAFDDRSVTLGALVEPLGWLHVGATVSPEMSATRSERTTIEDTRLANGSNGVRDATVLAKVRFPATWRLGVAANAGRHLLLSADAMRRDWGVYDGRLYEAESAGLESRIGGGLEYRPLRWQWWGRLAYRAGVSRLTWPQRVGGNPLRETTLHVGTGLDIKNSRGRLDLGFEYASLGSFSQNGREERTWRFMFGFSGQEVWSRRSPR